MHPTCAIIFDLDGTLIDSLDDIAAALNTVLHTHGFPQIEPDRVRRYVGDGVTALCRRAAPQADAQQVAALRERFMGEYASHLLDQTRLYPDISDVLQALCAADVPMGVLSNKPDVLTRRIVTALCDPGWFRAVRGVRDERERKPSPALALEVAAGLRARPESIFIVGDSTVDVTTARNAGMKSIAVTWGFRSAEELREQAPDYVVDDPRAIMKLPQLEGATCPIKELPG